MLKPAARLTLVLALVMSTAIAPAETPCSPARTIRVTGGAHVQVAPDRATASFSVSTRHRDAARAKADNDSRTRKLLEYLQSQGVAPSDLQTDYLDIGLESEDDSDGRKKRVRMVAATRHITALIRDIPRLENLLSAVLSSGGTGIGTIEFEISEIRKYRDQARALAIRAAREKAVKLASELGAKVGAVLTITDEGWGGSSSRSPRSPFTVVQVAYEPPPASEEITGTVAPGMIAVSAQVDLTFLLE